MKRVPLIVIMGIAGIFLFGCPGDNTTAGGRQNGNALPMAEITSPTEFGFDFAEVTLCERIENREPINAGDQFDKNNTSTVYLFTKIGNEGAPGIIFHRWYKWREQVGRPGAWVEVQTLKLDVPNVGYRTYSFLNIQEGVYRVDVLASDGKTPVWSQIFPVYGNTFTLMDYQKILAGETEEQNDPNAPDFSSMMKIEEGIVCTYVDKENNYQAVNAGTSFNIADLNNNKIWIRLLYTSAEASEPILQWSKKDDAGQYIAFIDYPINFKQTETTSRTFYNMPIDDLGEYKVEIFTPDKRTCLWSQNFTVNE